MRAWSASNMTASMTQANQEMERAPEGQLKIGLLLLSTTCDWPATQQTPQHRCS